MAEKRKLLAEIEKCFKKIDEGVELFEETMTKLNEANSDNQREKLQDDLKKEIKKLQRLRDQVKSWQSSSEIKDKEKLNHYRKVIEQRMEQFKDVERENKTKPHSKQGLILAEKVDPEEQARQELLMWINDTIKSLESESDKFEASIEQLNSVEGNRRRGKGKDDGKKAEKEKELRSVVDSVKFHIDKLQVCMRLVQNETLDSKEVSDAVRDELDQYLEQLQNDETIYDCEAMYDDLNLDQYTVVFGKHSSVDDTENGVEGHSNGGHHASHQSSPTGDHGVRHGSSEVPASPGLVKRLPSISASHPNTPLKINFESTHGESPSLVSPPAPPTPPPPPSIPYNSIAAGLRVQQPPPPVVPLPPLAAPSPPSTPSSQGVTGSTEKGGVVEEEAPPPPPPPPPRAPSPSPSPIVANDENVDPLPVPAVTAVAPPDPVSTQEVSSPVEFLPLSEPPALAEGESESRHEAVNGEETMTPKETEEGAEEAEMTKAMEESRNAAAVDSMTEDLRAVLRMNQQEQPKSHLPQKAHIPAWMGASPLGRIPHEDEDKQTQILSSLEVALERLPQQMDSERPRSYLPKMPCPTPNWYPQQAPVNADSMEYYLRLSPETLFFTFYYMEGSRAQLLAAKALKKLSWRFHTKYLMWFQRHEEPKQITDDYEEGTYVYFDYEKWSQRKKEAFRFEYRYLEDKEFD